MAWLINISEVQNEVMQKMHKIIYLFSLSNLLLWFHSIAQAIRLEAPS